MSVISTELRGSVRWTASSCIYLFIFWKMPWIEFEERLQLDWLVNLYNRKHVLFSCRVTEKICDNWLSCWMEHVFFFFESCSLVQHNSDNSNPWSDSEFWILVTVCSVCLPDWQRTKIRRVISFDDVLWTERRRPLKSDPKQLGYIEKGSLDVGNEKNRVEKIQRFVLSFVWINF